MRVSGVFATHYHADHVGGDLGGRAQIAGIVELLETIDVPIHVQADEVGVGDEAHGRRRGLPRRPRRR